MSPRVDFHLHTHYSDGTLSPGDLFERLRHEGLDYFSITDHDTISAYEVLHPRGCVAGVEINTNAPSEALHILGFGAKLLKSPIFEKGLASYRAARLRRSRLIIEKMRHELHLGIDWAHVASSFKGSVGRPHIADALRRLNIVKSRREAFQRFLLRGRPGYVPPLGPTPQEAVELIVRSEGVAVLAHPGVAAIDIKKLSFLVEKGLRGIEVYYPEHSMTQIKRYLEWARKFNLFILSGSDYHGPGSGKEKFFTHELPPKILNPFLEAVR